MRFEMTITGVTPLLMHQDNLEWSDRMEGWIKDPDNKGRGKKGDDRRPGFAWIGALYHDGGRVVLTNEMLMKALVQAGAKFTKVKQETYKASVAAGVWLDAMNYPLTVGGKEVNVGPLLKRLDREEDFEKHCKEVAKLGLFKLDTRRVGGTGKGKWVRVRPMFNRWECVVSGELDAELLPADVFTRVADLAGSRMGLGDWRPSAPSPGTRGMFKADVKFTK